MNQPQKLPAGWSEEQIRNVAAHYDQQSEEDEADEIEVAISDEKVTFVAVPLDLVDEVRALISRRLSA